MSILRTVTLCTVTLRTFIQRTVIQEVPDRRDRLGRGRKNGRRRAGACGSSLLNLPARRNRGMG